MGQLSRYIEAVGLAGMLVAGLVIAGYFVLVPTRHRMVVALAAMPVWVTCNRLTLLGGISTIAKATTILCYLLVLWSAWKHPGMKRELPRILWLYPIMAVIWLVCVARADPIALTLARQIQWIALTLAALAVTGTVTDRESFLKVLRALAVGFLMAVVLMSASLVSGRYGVRLMGRLWPFGANPNQVGVAIGASVCLACIFCSMPVRAFAESAGGWAFCSPSCSAFPLRVDPSSWCWAFPLRS